MDALAVYQETKAPVLALPAGFSSLPQEVLCCFGWARELVWPVAGWSVAGWSGQWLAGLASGWLVWPVACCSGQCLAGPASGWLVWPVAGWSGQWLAGLASSWGRLLVLTALHGQLGWVGGSCVVLSSLVCWLAYNSYMDCLVGWITWLAWLACVAWWLCFVTGWFVWLAGWLFHVCFVLLASNFVWLADWFVWLADWFVWLVDWFTCVAGFLIAGKLVCVWLTGLFLKITFLAIAVSQMCCILYLWWVIWWMLWLLFSNPAVAIPGEVYQAGAVVWRWRSSLGGCQTLCKKTEREKVLHYTVGLLFEIILLRTRRPGCLTM